MMIPYSDGHAQASCNTSRERELRREIMATNGAINEIGNDRLMGVLPEASSGYIAGNLGTIAGGRYVV